MSTDPLVKAHSISPATPRTSATYRLTGFALAVLGVLAFSVRPLLIKVAYGYGSDPVTLLALRMAFSLPFFVVMAAWAWRRHAGHSLSPSDIWLVAGLGCLGYYLASFLDFLGLQYVTAGIGRLLLFLYPTIVVVLSALFLKKPIRAREVVSLVSTYAGVALVLSQAMSGSNIDLPLGATLVFASATAYAIYLVAGSQVVARLGSLRFTAWAMIAASVACLIQFALLRPLSALNLPAEVYWLTVAMATVSTVMPVFATAEALRRLGANHVALVGALGPVSAIGLGHVGLDETLTWLQAVGAVLVLAGVLLVSLKPDRR